MPRLGGKTEPVPQGLDFPGVRGTEAVLRDREEGRMKGVRGP